MHGRRYRVGILSSLLLAGCGQSVSVELSQAGDSVYRCDAAEVHELNPKPGGWAFKCEGGGSLYIVLATDDGPAKGTVKEIVVTQANGELQSYLAGYLVGGTDTCASAKPGDAGPLALVSKGSGVVTGIYTFAMGEPCATLELTLK